MNKYKLTDKTKDFAGITLYQIKALKDFAEVKKGDLGGWIEKESNLSQYGDAWVFGNARVCEDASVFGNARVSGDAWVSGNAKVNSKIKVIGDFGFYVNTAGQYLRIGCKFLTYKQWDELINSESFPEFLKENEAENFWAEAGTIVQELIKIGLKEGRNGE